ncbi:MAG: VTT domain-containing protein [Gammaproteobacteria bacterium]|nr:VTT domain-containing protein [Gammaproteobacteria bacterium]
MNSKNHLISFISIVLLLAITYLILSKSELILFFQDELLLQQWILSLGSIGPLSIIALMALAIVMSPIPSAPIAMVSGAVYGHTWGAIYIIIGAEIGAIMAFFIARLLGETILTRWFGHALFVKGLLGSQNSLMGIILVSRLLPFVSFDMVSYAAGLTPLTFWRFSIATLAGITPVSFLLAHFGSELATGESQRMGSALLLLGIFPAAFLLYKWFSSYRKKTSHS